jgi:hypothetical protein
MWILGDSFLRNYLTIYEQDLGGMGRVGLVGTSHYSDIGLTFVVLTTYLGLALMLGSMTYVIIVVIRHKKYENERRE